MTTIVMKLLIGGLFMPAASTDKFAQHLSEADKIFPAEDFRNKILSEADEIACEAIVMRQFKSWRDLATGSEIRGNSNLNVDLGEIPRLLTRTAFVYFLPGFLLHFLRCGTYSNSIWGPAFYFNFIHRLQPDQPDIIAAGGADVYFSLTAKQKECAKEIMLELKHSYGDSYEKFEYMGYEYQDLAKYSISRAIHLFWGRK